MSHPPSKYIWEGLSLSLVGFGIAEWIPWLLAAPGALYYCWLLWDKWKARRK